MQLVGSSSDGTSSTPVASAQKFRRNPGFSGAAGAGLARSWRLGAIAICAAT